MTVPPSSVERSGKVQSGAIETGYWFPLKSQYLGKLTSHCFMPCVQHKDMALYSTCFCMGLCLHTNSFIYRKVTIFCGYLCLKSLRIGKNFIHANKSFTSL